MRTLETMVGLESDFGYEHIPGVPSSDYSFGADSPPQIIIQSQPASSSRKPDWLGITVFAALLGGAIYATKHADKLHLPKLDWSRK